MRTYEEISDIIYGLSDYVFEKLSYWFEEWAYEKAPKARFNYWLKKAGITEDEYWLWHDL